jgi:hypothetical protein
MSYLEAVLKLRPGAKIALVGGTTYDNIDWHGTDPISKIELDAALTLVAVDVAKTAKLTQITKDRDTAIAQPVTVHGRTWQADAESQRNLSNEILTAQAGVFLTPVWRDADNSNMPITDIQQLIDIAAAMKIQTLTAYQTSWARKAAVEAAGTVEEVDGV